MCTKFTRLRTKFVSVLKNSCLFYRKFRVDTTEVFFFPWNLIGVQVVDIKKMHLHIGRLS